MKRRLVLMCGVASYVMFLGVFLYAIGFVGGILIPTTIDGVPTSSLGVAVLVNIALLAVFAAQHSLMARPRGR